MGWGITLHTGIYYSKVNIRCKQDITDRIQEIEETLNNIKSRLLQFAIMTEPKKFVPEDSDPMYWLEAEINEMMEEYNELCFEQSKLYILESDWDEAHHKDTKMAIVPDDAKELDKVYMHGDFIKMCTADGKEIDEDTYWKNLH